MKKAIYYILMLVLLFVMVGCDGGTEAGGDKVQTPTVGATKTPTPTSAEISENTPTPTSTLTPENTPTPSASEQKPTVAGTPEDEIILLPTEGAGGNPTEVPTVAPTNEPTAVPTETPVATPTTGVIELPFVPF